MASSNIQSTNFYKNMDIAESYMIYSCWGITIKSNWNSDEINVNLKINNWNTSLFKSFLKEEGK